MKKHISLLLLIFICLTTLSGCDLSSIREAQTSSTTQEYATIPERNMPDTISEAPVSENDMVEGDTPVVTTPESIAMPEESIPPEETVATIQPDCVRIAETWQMIQSPDIPAYSGQPCIDITADSDLADRWSEFDDCRILLSPLDELSRRGSAIMLASPDIMPTGERGPTGDCKPSGWIQNKYPGIVDSDPPYLYNRAHLLAWAICSLTDEPLNLITGTRYFNTEAMLPTEIEVIRYVEAGGELLYRVTPLYTGSNLLADGVIMEAVNRDGSFHICRFAYNVQPGIEIDYATGANKAVSEPVAVPTSDPIVTEPASAEPVLPAVTYVLNTSSHKYHRPTCPSVEDIKPKNRQDFYGTKEEAEAMGYVGCKNCQP